MISTEQYLQAKKVVDQYELEQLNIHLERVEEFQKDLKDYFNNNLIDSHIQLKEFHLDINNNWIIPDEPCLEEDYEGTNDDDIRKISQKYNFKLDFKIVYWCYHK